MNTVWYFAYDVTLNLDFMKRIVGTWLRATPAIIRGYTLGFTTFVPSWGGGTADIIEREDGIVYGGAYQLEERQLEALDRFQGVPHIYRRIPVVVEADEGRLEAITYTVVKKRSYIPPTDSYLSLILKGLRHHGYENGILQFVKKAAKG